MYENMRTMNFDEIIDRSGRGAVKTDFAQERFGTTDIIPMWVADMDFRSPQCVVNAIKRDLDYGVLGYHAPQQSYYEAIINWQKKHHQMLLKADWIKYTPGVVSGIAIAINAFTEKYDKIVVQPPVYFPFFEYPLRNKREVVYNSLIEKDGNYYMDYVDLEQHFRDGAKMLLLCSPHNPAGRIWSRNELAKVAALAERYGVLVIADEIHADLALHGAEIVSYATLSEEAAQHSITMIAPSKTFNIAGLASAVTIIQNDALRKKWVAASEAYELHVGDFLSYSALTAAFTEGEPWREELLAYLQQNMDYTMAYFEQYIPQITPWRPQASFLMWLDCRSMGLTDGELMRFFVERAKLGLNAGESFGKGGSGFMRLNFAVPFEVLKMALLQLRLAFDSNVKS